MNTPHGARKGATNPKARKLAPIFRGGYAVVGTLIATELKRRSMSLQPALPGDEWKGDSGKEAWDEVALIQAEMMRLEEAAVRFPKRPEKSLSELAALAEVLLPTVEARLESDDLLIRHCAISAAKRLKAAIKAAEDVPPKSDAPWLQNRIVQFSSN